MRDLSIDIGYLAKILQACSDEWMDCAGIGKRCLMSPQTVGIKIPSLINNYSLDYKFGKHANGKLKPFYRRKQQQQAPGGAKA